VVSNFGEEGLVNRSSFGLGFVLAILAATIVGAPARAQPAAEPRLVVEREAVRIEAAAPGSRWLVVGYGRELTTPVSIRGYFRWQVVGDTTRAGAIALDLKDAPVPPLSAWAAFEIDTGRLLAVRPHSPLPALEERSISTRAPVSLGDLDASEALLFVLRRGEGGWVWTGRADLATPGQPGLAVLLPRPEHFVPVSDDQAELLGYRAGDRFLAIDQGSLEVTLTRLD
jgi:hypothetical protein